MHPELTWKIQHNIFEHPNIDYRQISNVRRTKSQNSNVARLILQLSLHNLFKPGVQSEMKM